MFDRILKNKDIIYIFIVSRIIFFLLMYVSNNNLQELYNLFDGKHYLSIAQNGYWEIRLTAFFPLVPLIIKCFGKIGLFIINNICFLMSLFIINEIKKEDINNKLTLLFFAFSPIAFFSMLYYTESIFLFLTMYSFYLVKNKKYGLLLGIVLGMSVATRNSGSLLFFAIFIFMLLLLIKKEIRLTTIIKTYIPATIISCLYPLYLQINFGNWKIFMDCQYTEWQKIKTNIFSTLGYQYRVIFLGESGCRPYWLVKYVHAFNEILTITLTIFIVYLIIKEIKKIRKSKNNIQPNIVLILYLAFSLICFNSTIKMIEYDAPTISFYRYYLALFPIYLLLENLNIKTRKIITIMMFLLSIIVVFFFSTGNFFY